MSQDYYQPAPKTSSWALRLTVGCLGLFLLGTMACGGVAYFAFTRVMSNLDQLTQEYTDKGYVKQSGQFVDVRDTPSEPTVYFGQVVTINEKIPVDIAIVAQVATIKADVNGNVDFMGQSLTIGPDAVLHSDLHIKGGQAVIIQGNVLGKITGNYQSLIYKGKTYREGESVPELGSESEFQIPLDEERP